MAREQSKKVVVKGVKKGKKATSEKRKVDKKKKVDVEYSQDEVEDGGELVVADSGASIVEESKNITMMLWRAILCPLTIERNRTI